MNDNPENQARTLDEIVGFPPGKLFTPLVDLREDTWPLIPESIGEREQFLGAIIGGVFRETVERLPDELKPHFFYALLWMALRDSAMAGGAPFTQQVINQFAAEWTQYQQSMEAARQAVPPPVPSADIDLGDTAPARPRILHS